MSAARRKAKGSPVQAVLRALDALYLDHSVRFRLMLADDDEEDADDVELRFDVVDTSPAE